MIASIGGTGTFSVAANRSVRQRERRDGREQAANTLQENQQRQHEQRVMGIEYAGVVRDIRGPGRCRPGPPCPGEGGGGNSTVALRLPAERVIVTDVDLCMRWIQGRYFALDSVNSMSPGFHVLLIAASVGPYNRRTAK